MIHGPFQDDLGEPAEFLLREQPVEPVAFFAPMVLQATAKRWIDGFSGQVAFAVGSDAPDMVIANLAAAGLGAYVVADLDTPRLVRRTAPGAELRCALPLDDVAGALAVGVTGFTIDSPRDFAALVQALPLGAEVEVRGAPVGATAALLCAVRDAGFASALTLDLGADPAMWGGQIRAAARLATAAGVALVRLTLLGAVGAPEVLSAAVGDAMGAFGANAPALTCVLGRALSDTAFNLAARAGAPGDDTGGAVPGDGRVADFVILPLYGFSPVQTRLSGLGEVRVATVMRLHG